MSVPTMEVDERALKSAVSTADELRLLATRIIEALRVYPHFLLLTGLEPTEDRSVAEDLARLIATTPPTPQGISREKLLKVSFTKLKIDQERANAGGNSTAYSRTNQPLTLHTDSSYLAKPHPLVVFQFVRSDPGGGETVLGAVEDLMEAIDDDMAQTLRTTPMPFGKGNAPVLYGKPDAPKIRHYRNQIDNAVAAGSPLPDASRALLDRLDTVLAEGIRTYRFHGAAGSILFLQNTRILHGRTGFQQTSDRLMYRLRMHSGCLG